MAVDSSPDALHRFNICRIAFGAKAHAYLCSVYDLSPRTFGTFDTVFFFGVLYHLRHPLLALERIRNVCTGTFLMQTATGELPGSADIPVARFFPSGIESGPRDKPIVDPTVFWLPNTECALAMVRHVGFREIDVLPTHAPMSLGLRAKSLLQAPGQRPDDMAAPWS